MKVIEGKPGLDTIRTDEVCWTLAVGDSTRRSLIRYFRPRILEAVLRHRPKDYEMPPGFKKPERLADIDPIEDLAWRMADHVISNIQTEIEDVYEVAFVGFDADEAFTSVLGESIEEIESEFLQEAELSLDLEVTFQMAFGIPFHIAGSDEPEDDGPDDAS